MLVVDLSDYQPDNLEALVGAGVGGVIVKVAEGLGTGGAAHAAAKMEHAQAARLVVLAAYDFARPGSALDEADFFLHQIGSLPVHAGVVDAEVAGVGPAFCLEWCQEVTLRLGTLAGVYVSPGFANANHFGTVPGLARYWLWLADYFADYGPGHQPPVPAPWTAWAGWQYTDRLPVPGFGTVDASIFRDDFVQTLQGADMTSDEHNMLQALYQVNFGSANRPQPSFLEDIHNGMSALLAVAGKPVTATVDAQALADKIVTALSSGLDGRVVADVVAAITAHPLVPR